MERNIMGRLVVRPVVLLLLLVPVVLRADEVDDYVEKQMKSRRLPGLSLAVVKDGKVVKAKGYGFANLELEVPARAETVYQSASVGKQFTSMAVMLLIEDGKLGLEDKASKYLDGAPEAWKEVTVRHLLTHTSGIKNYTSTKIDYHKDYTDAELRKLVFALPLDFAPGEKWRYCNTGYLLLGWIIEKASGKFYADYLQERVFKPLEMTTARINSEADIIKNRAAGYREVLFQWKNQDYVSPSLNRTADGSLVLSVLDMAKWDAALYTERLLKKDRLELLWTPVKLNSGKTSPYGFGWQISEVQGRRCIEHSGGWQGFSTHISRFVDDRLGVIVFVNLDGGKASAIAHGVARHYLPAGKE
jgi:CubicO group peptidase (beta-lactamase class C family)